MLLTKLGMATFLVGAVAAKLAAAEPAAALDKPGAFEKKWEPLHELMTALAERDGLRWAMPETLAARVIVGGDNIAARAALDEACKQARFSWVEANGIVVVHCANDARLKDLTDALKAGGARSAEAAWELGWLRDARAVPALAEALAGSDLAAALAAAQAVEVLCKSIPLGRTDRVDPMLPGRVELSAAFPPKADLGKLLDSPYPPIRAAAARLMLGTGGAAAEEAKTRTAADRSFLVEQVRQQMLFESPAAGKPRPKNNLPPLPKTEDEVKAQCDKMYAELSPLGKASAWEGMRRHADTVAAWANAGNDYAFETLVKFVNFRQGNCEWFEGYAQTCMTTVGGEKGTAKLRELLARTGYGVDRGGIARKVEQWAYGPAMMDFLKANLGDQTVSYVVAWRAGREAYEEFLAAAAKGSYPYPAVDALGAIGGPRAVGALKETLVREEKNSGTLAFRSAKALGQAGGPEALAALLTASSDPSRQRRHAAALFLGRVGGPEAVKKLVELAAKDPDRMVRAGAATALEEIGAKEGLEAAAAFRKADEGLPPLVYGPRNKRFGPEFPENEWVDLKIKIIAYSNYGEMGWNYDAANKLFFRYGGCDGYMNELTAFDLGTEEFTQRRPNEQGAGWDQRRPKNGCSAGRTWDPYLKVGWIGPAIFSGSGPAVMEYYNKDWGWKFCSYDFAADRFRPAVYRAPAGDDQVTRYAYDWKHGLMMPVRFNGAKQWFTFNTRAADPYAPEAWSDKTNKASEFPPACTQWPYCNAAVHQETGLLVAYVTPDSTRPPETWTYDPEANLWKNMQPKETPHGVQGGGLVYDPFRKVMLLHSGKTRKQFGGPDDAITWAYDPKANVWTDMNPKGGGPGNPWVGAMDYDPEHNVTVVFCGRGLWAYRYKQVPVGTRAQ